MIFVALTHREALRLRDLLLGVRQGWELGDAMIAHITESFPTDPPSMTAEDRANMDADKRLLGDVLNQLALQITNPNSN